MPDNTEGTTPGSTVMSQENLICAGVLIVAVILAAFLYPGLGSLAIWSCAIALGTGAVAWGVLHFVKSNYRITSTEATIASVFLMLVIVPVVDHVGSKMAFDNKVSYQEFWGGYEAAALTGVTVCEKDGSCVHTYACDWYWEKVIDQHAYTEPGYTDANKVYHPPVYHPEVSHMEHRHHDCPYVKQEYTFTVRTTLGDYTIGSHWVPANPQAHRWHGDDGGDYESNVPGNIPRGIPEQWAAAKARIDSGDPGPVTREHSYENYILASQDEALKRYSPYIDAYLQRKILPDLNHSVQNFYYMDRAYFVGDVGDRSGWSASVERFNAALGASLQGDLYLVVVDTKQVTDPDNYISTLTAYWQSAKFDKYAISKNAIVVVLGTEDGRTVKWARASTGMPTGNSTMIYSVQNELGGKPLTPLAILGQPRGLLSPKGADSYKVTVLHTQNQGALESIMWGENGFKRVCMSCKDEGDSGVGFDYLKTQIKPTGGQLAGIYSVVFIFSLLVWGAMVFLAVPSLREVLGREPFGSGNNPQSFISRFRNRRRF